ncbi:MAG: DUF4846 domain-containing protein [Clostridiaceae bacterium]
MEKKNIVIYVIIAFTLTSCKQREKIQDLLPGETPETIPISESAPIEEPNEALKLIESGTRLFERFPAPKDSQRTDLEAGSFGEYLRSLSLKTFGEQVTYFNGGKKPDRAYISVVDQDITKRNLQQCADAIMRLKGEYHYARGEYDKISFHFVNGFLCDFKTWSKGNTVTIDGNKTYWTSKASNDSSYESFRKYMDLVHAYASTLSLEDELQKVNTMEMKVGDVFIKGGSPGHAIIVVDMAEDLASGKKYFMLAQSYMPAQETQILRNLNDPSISPWYELKEGTLITPEWEFDEGSLKRFP